MAKTNFQIFNEENAPERTYNDSEYKEATQRVGGVMPGMALSRMHNKMYYQWSAMCKAIANLIVNRGRNCMDNDVDGITKSLEETITSAATGIVDKHSTKIPMDHPSKSITGEHIAEGAIAKEHLSAPLVTLIRESGIAILQRKRAYLVGDIAYSARLPSWVRLECVKAGTTAADEPAAFAQMSSGGVLITDGDVLWIVDDVRDGTPVGAVRGSLYLPTGYVKANGATVQRADYPRFIALADKHNLWTDDTAANAGLFGRGDGVATMALPNWTDRMVQLAGDGAGASVAAGLPNITGTTKMGFILGNLSGIAPTGDGAVTVKIVDSLSNYDAGRAARSTVGIDASKSNPIYGASSTVQPPAIKLIPIIRY